MTAKALPLLLALGAAALPDLFRPQLPAGLQRWLYNPRERTERAIAAQKAGEDAEALRHAETALRLAPDDPRVQYNAGSAALAAGRERRAGELLDKAVKGAPPGLAPSAHYNLGNARLAEGNPAAAVEAYKQALRLAPGHQDAKHNLEIALRQRDKQRQRFGLPRQGARGSRRGEQPTSEAGRRRDNPPEQRPQPSPTGAGGEQRREQRSQGSPQERPGDPRGGGAAPGGNRPLPQFNEQPDMSAGEAAALLEAVENLERQQRRETAAKQSRKRALRGKDW